MHSATTADRRSAHRRVGVAATAAFLALLILALTRGPAAADPAVPAATPTPTPTVAPAQPAPADPDPYSDPGFPRDREPGGSDGHPGFGGGGDGSGGGDRSGGGDAPGGAAPGGGAAPAPNANGGQT